MGESPPPPPGKRTCLRSQDEARHGRAGTEVTGAPNPQTCDPDRHQSMQSSHQDCTQACFCMAPQVTTGGP